MEIAETVLQLAAHKGVLEAEIARLETDIDFMKQLGHRYGGPKAAKTSEPTKDLAQLKQTKEKQLAAVEQQMELFRLHHASGKQLLSQLAGPGQTAIIPPLVGPSLNAMTNSPILADSGAEGLGKA